MDTGFLSLPMTAGRRDIAVAEDDAGNPVYMTPFGQRYTIRRQNPAQGSRVKAGLEVLKEASKAPLESLTAAAQAMAQGAWQGISAPGRAAAGEPMTYGDVAATAMDWGLMNAPGLAFGKYDPATVNMGIRAYHGSPHDFDRFDMSKIGTGEGAQAYGHGLYFAEAEDVAKNYKTSNSATANFRYNGRPIKDELRRSAAWSLSQHGGDKAAVLDEWSRMYKPEFWETSTGRGMKRALDGLDYSKLDNGHLYEVSINADPADFLDWDAPLSESNPLRDRIRDNARKVMDSASFGSTRNKAKDAYLAAGSENLTGEGAYNSLALGGSKLGNLPSKETASRALRDAGIPGIKYYDQGSRAGKEGTRNYVVFDDSLIDILRKYGVAGLAPLGATLAGSDQAQY